jgi:hypothetical protein
MRIWSSYDIARAGKRESAIRVRPYQGTARTRTQYFGATEMS